MLKDEYKKHYDQVHPSPELIERTKKLALKHANDARQQDDEEWLAEMETPYLKDRRSRWIKLAGGLAAGVAVVVTGMYLGQSLKPQQTPATEVATVEETPVVTEEIISTEAPQIQDKKETQKDKITADSQVKAYTNKKLEKSIAEYPRETVTLDYASSSVVIFHSNFGIVAYSLSSQSILINISSKEFEEYGEWQNQTVEVNAAGDKIYWHDPDYEKQLGKEYDFSTGKLTVIKNGDWKETPVYNVQSVQNTQANIYREDCTVGTTVNIGDAGYCQLVYIEPESSSQASLGISLFNLNVGTENIYSIFEKNELSEENYKNLHKEQGETDAGLATDEPMAEVTEIPNENFEVTAEPKPEQQEQPTAEPIDEPQITEEIPADTSGEL